MRQPPAPVRQVSTLAMILNADAEKPALSAPRVSVSVLPTVSTPHSLHFARPLLTKETVCLGVEWAPKWRASFVVSFVMWARKVQ